ncbi:unnamed protein product [Rotaria sp. Silwood1]|nr:unnamed protein product [Rotaria sp. Silwood1]
MILIIIIYISTIFHLFIVESSHFYGGTVTWKSLDNKANGSTVSVMFTQSYQWRQSAAASYCDQSYVLNQSPLIPTVITKLQCITSPISSCGGYYALNTNEYCTDFSTFLDSSSGQISAVQNITIGSKFCVAFQGASWIGLQTVNCGTSVPSASNTTTISTTTVSSCYNTGSSWSIGCCLDLSIRLDGIINTPPVATIISPIHVPVNTKTNIKIPVIDADNDVIRCRWAQNTTSLDECGDVCGIAPGSTLNSNDCTLLFDSTGTIVGQYYPITLMVEDFYTASSYSPFSSIPLQFLIKIVSTSNCFIKPTLSSNLSNCTAISVGVQFNFTLTIQQGCSNTTIVDIFRTPPVYMYKSDLTQIGSTNIWIATESWIPTVDQIGSQVYCAMATDSNSLQSDLYCTTFTVISLGQALYCPTDFTWNRTAVTSTTSTTTSTSVTTTSSTTNINQLMITTVPVHASDNSGLNSLILGLILGLGLPLLLLLTVLAFCCCCCDHFKFLSGNFFRRYFKRNRNLHQQDNLPDYRHQYINDNNVSQQKYELILCNETQNFTKENSIISTSLSDIQTNYMNITRTSLLSPSSYSLPNDDVQYTRNNSSRSAISAQNDSILMYAYSVQEMGDRDIDPEIGHGKKPGDPRESTSTVNDAFYRDEKDPQTMEKLQQNFDQQQDPLNKKPE